MNTTIDESKTVRSNFLPTQNAGVTSGQRFFIQPAHTERVINGATMRSFPR